MALVDVLIPTCGRKTALAVTMAGLVAQTFQDFDVTIADQTEGAPYLEDGELATLYRALALAGRRVRRLRNLPRRGMAQQRHFLLQQAQAPLVHYLDDDVLLGPTMLERMVRVLQEEGCGFVGAGVSGLRHLDDTLPDDVPFEPWRGPVRPEPHTWATIPWPRYRLHIRDHPLLLTRRYAADGLTVRYKVAWVGANVVYDREKLESVGGFGWWERLPPNHSGEEVLVQLLLARRYGGCAILPAEAYHLELPSQVPDREVKADHMFEELAPVWAPLATAP
ncbi:MAG TPA: glycosyltransferase family A protein [Anaerolineae bacterium]|nr:glycosyltransferase family A protein [Anaerolineae bacterium]HOR00221.1 glycosyltransferase family A protein [Anaerolineae bacterium]HPL28264.1 glycosyltransferase family A protein [Anaerolineae bacterium]